MTRLLVPAGCFYLLLVIPCVATDHYVSTTGSDSGDGTVNSPWRTIQRAASAVNPGDRVTVGDGVYNETVAITRGGTPRAPVVFVAQHKWAAKIVPTSTAGNNNYTLSIASASYVSVQNFDITGTPTTDSIVKFYVSAPNNSLVGNSIHGSGVSYTDCISGSGVLIADNNEKISNNWIWNIGPRREAGFRCNQQHGIYVTAGSGGRIENNVIFQIWQGWSFHFNGKGLSNWTVVNNTIFNGGDNVHQSGGGFMLHCLGGSCDGNRVSKNIFANMQGFAFFEWNDGGSIGTGNVYENNVVFHCPISKWLHGRSANELNVDPEFVNYTGDQNGDYHLKHGSPASGRGAVTAARPWVTVT
jgi:hypothetical protein